MKYRGDHDQKRYEIAEIAARLIATNDIKGITTQQIADACGASKGKIFHYFKSKEEIIEAAFEWGNDKHIGHLQRLLDASSDADAVDMRAAENAVIQIFPLTEETDIEWRVKLNYWQYMLSDAKTYNINYKRLKESARTVSALIQRYQDKGLVRADSDTEEIAWTLIDIVHGGCLNLLSLPMKERRKRANTLIAYVRSFIS